MSWYAWLARPRQTLNEIAVFTTVGGRRRRFSEMMATVQAAFAAGSAATRHSIAATETLISLPTRMTGIAPCLTAA